MSNPTNGPDDELRRLLHDAVSDVQPHDALDRIRSQTDKVVPMNRRTNRRWILPSFAAAAVMAAVIGGAFWMVRDDDSVAGPADTPSSAPSTSPDASQTPEPEDVTERAVPVYYVGAAARGDKLYREFQRQQVCKEQDCLLKAATASAVTGTPEDPDYRAPWPDGTKLNAVAYDGETLTIDLSGDIHDRPAGMSQSGAELAIQQLIYSAQAGLGKGRVPVQLLLDGKHTDQILGVPASEPLAAANADDVLAPVQVDSPANGADVSSSFTVSGRAATFEANVVWELKQGGTVVEHGFTTAQECCTLAPFSFDVKNVEPGQYTLFVHDTDESGEGRAVNEDTKEITVQ